MYNKTMESKRDVLQWDIMRYGLKIDLDSRIIPNTKEAEAIAELERSYTGFRNMLRYSKSVPDYNFDHSTADAVDWDPDMEYITTT